MTLVSVVIIGIILVSLLLGMDSPSAESDKPPQSERDKYALEVLSGKTSAEDAAESAGVSAEEIGKWKADYLKRSAESSKRIDELNRKVGELTMEVEWFRKTSEKYIGEDWKDKTGYNDRK